MRMWGCEGKPSDFTDRHAVQEMAEILEKSLLTSSLRRKNNWRRSPLGGTAIQMNLPKRSREPVLRWGLMPAD